MINEELPEAASDEVQSLPITTMSVQPSPFAESVVPKGEENDHQPEEEETKEEKKKKTGKSVLMKMLLIGQIMVEYFIDLFNRNSRDYREVSKKLSEMKSRDKIAQQEQRIRSRTTVSIVNFIFSSHSQSNIHFQSPIERPNSLGEHPRTRTLSDPNERSRFYRLFDSLFYFVMSRSELLCYSAMVINHLTSGTLLSMPLPLSIFLWAMLSSRPSRNYWITVITYTEAMIVIKYIFQFQFFPWDETSSDYGPLAPINIIGINRQENEASIADLFLLLSLFLHRSILKVMSLEILKIFFMRFCFSNLVCGKKKQLHLMVS